MNIMALTPHHTVDAAPMLLHTVISLALESLDDGRNVTDINMVLGVSTTADDGRNAVRYVLSYQPLNAILCFGATAQSFGLATNVTAVRKPIAVQFRSQLLPVTVVCLPAALSDVWRSTETMFAAAAAIKPLLARSNDDIELLDIETMAFTDPRDLN